MRIAAGLLVLLVVLGALFGAGWAYFRDDAPQFAAIGLGVAAGAFLLRMMIRRWARDR